MKESETLELKKSTSELKEALKSIVAIVNKHQKGELYFGVKRDGDVVGQSITENTIREVSKAISDHIEPKIFPKIKELVLDGKKCVYVEFTGRHVPYYAFGRAYIRVGDEDKRISALELEKLILQKNKEKLRWDLAICEKATLDDIDDNSIKKFVDFSMQSKRLSIEHDDIEMILRKLKLMSGSKITNAGILLFGKQATNFFDNVIIRCGRFKGVVKEEFIDIKDFEGNLFQNLEKVIAFLQEHLQLQATIKGLHRQEKWEIPLEALREAVINAFIHRDYDDHGFVYIKLYDGELIISNPGKLQNLTISDLYKEYESKLRNPLLAQVFYYAGFIDVWGRGILNILRLLKENDLPKPIFQQSAGAFRIVFKR
ncbi:MAG: RNA-binding domain-containing protein, partial [Nanoarchaeota archaeon]